MPVLAMLSDFVRDVLSWFISFIFQTENYDTDVTISGKLNCRVLLLLLSDLLIGLFLSRLKSWRHEQLVT